MIRALLLCVAFLSLLPGCEPGASARLRLATTTSTRDSGLLDQLLPVFEREARVRVDVIAVGTGKALKLGEAGDVDLVLVHARQAEDTFMAAGHGVRREDVMYNRFEILGPSADPAKVAGQPPAEVLTRIARGGHRFVSRGDDSGTHKRELALWEKAGGLKPWDGYIETGQGMGNSLVIANEKEAYVLADRGTYLAFRDKIDLVPLGAASEELVNRYGIMVVNPARHAHVDALRANALVDFFVSVAGQGIIGGFEVGGEPLFYPVHKP